MLDEQTRHFLDGLIHDGFQVPAQKLKKAVMERLAGLIPFDTALWASGHINGLKVHNVYLHGLPAELMVNWEKFKHQDRLLAHIMANPGVTCDVYDFYSRQERPSLEIYKQHSSQYGIENAISTAIPDPGTGLLEVMSLYREPGGPEFTRRERELKQFAFPLMASVWHQNQIAYLKSISGGDPSQAAAVCDRQGMLRHADPDFIDQIKSEWQDWSAPLLPEPLGVWLSAPNPGDFIGKQILVSAALLEDLFLLRSQPRGATAMLTPREEQVARSFANGLTYKEIAEKLKISPSTARRHLESIYKKLGVSNKLELAQELANKL
jgi:DNA-binding CsgD family transcriptional regulator